MQRNHRHLLAKLKGKKRIRVVFLAIHKSVWKVDQVFKKMLADPFFEPLILVCPYTVYGEEQMWKDMRESLNYFNEKGYPTRSSYSKKEKSWVSLEEVAPDIVFFTNPHALTNNFYYEDAYLNYLSCYAGYGMHTVNYDDGQSQYNKNFHNAVWKIFVQNKDMYDGYLKHSHRVEKNLHIVIDAAAEELLNTEKTRESVWKNMEGMKKIIWAPHHTINESFSLKLGNFLTNADQMLNLAQKTKNKVMWSFKPHPLLKPKLYKHPEWGKERTNRYWDFWSSQSNTQINEGEYLPLFAQSDAMMHDSASFLAEYIFTNKPMLYFVNDRTMLTLNNFGRECLDTAYHAISDEQAIDFVNRVIDGEDIMEKKRSLFIERYIENLSGSTKITEIIDILKMELLK